MRRINPDRALTDAEVTRRWRQKDRARYLAQASKDQRKKLYGLSPTQFAVLQMIQCGKCAICSEVMESPEVDHDHVTGRVRGLLCGHCNRGIGMFKESPERLAAAMAFVGGF